MTPAAQVHIQGAGKVGRALAAGLRQAGWNVRLSAHRNAPSPRIRASIVVLAVRDGQLPEVARRWAQEAIVPAGAVVLHTAGARTWETLAPLRARGVAVAQMHPLLSFVGTRRQIRWDGATMLVDGDAAAVTVGKRIARALGMHPRSMPGLDRSVYHASAALVAGGAAALVWTASTMLCKAGASRREAEHMLAPLLRSVAENVERSGLPGALSGVIRRADATTLEQHLRAARRYAPQHEALIRQAARGQLEMAGLLGEASDGKLGQIKALLGGQKSRGARAQAGAVRSKRPPDLGGRER